MGSSGRVLVLDDDEGVRSAFARVLTREGYSVQVAATQVFYKPLSLEDVRRVVRTLLPGGQADTTAEG
jgi:CheY-like chemotaxis protein